MPHSTRAGEARGPRVLRETNSRAKVAQKASQGGDARSINSATIPCHATDVMTALAFCRADDEDGLSGHRLLHPRWEWAEGDLGDACAQDGVRVLEHLAPC